MSDVMLIGVLRMPPECWLEGELDRFQRYSRYSEAADRIESDKERLSTCINALMDIAAMGRKAGSETAKNTLFNLGIDWETGEPTQNYGSMT